jgi:addiction module HigA family antidote
MARECRSAGIARVGRLCFRWADRGVEDVEFCDYRSGAGMTIRRESLEAGETDLTDVTDGARLAAVHPGDVLKHDYLEPLGMSVYSLAGALGVSRSRLNEIIQRRRTAVTAETALRLGRFFGASAHFWLGLQAAYDLDIARQTVGERIKAEVHPRAA